MQLFTQALPEKCNLYLASDLHVGCILTDYDRIGQLVDMVRSKNSNRLIVLGDLAESIAVDDKRFDEATTDKTLMTPMRQYEKVTEILRPVAKQILYINDGNHDYKLSKYVNFIRDVVCKQLEVPYGTYSSKLTVTDSKGKKRFKLFTTHGYGNVSSSADDPIRRKSNMKLSLKRKLAGKSADCVLQAMGHTHKLLVARPEKSLYFTDNSDTIKQHYTRSTQDSDYIPEHLRWYVNTGSFLRLYALGCSGYAERFGYDPVELGAVQVEIDGGIVDVKKVLM